MATKSSRMTRGGLAAEDTLLRLIAGVFDAGDAFDADSRGLAIMGLRDDNGSEAPGDGEFGYIPIASDGSIKVSLTSGVSGVGVVDKVIHNYGSSPVGDGAYVQVKASTAAAASKLQIFDSTGEIIIIALGAAASEVDYLYVTPGGNGLIDVDIPAGTRVSIKKAETGTLSDSTTRMVINFIG